MTAPSTSDNHPEVHTPTSPSSLSATGIQATELATAQLATAAAAATPHALYAPTDLTTEQGVGAYLDGTPFASSKVDVLSGGTANFVYRLNLETPYQGRETLVFKHAQPYVKDSRGIPFALERQFYEVEALNRVGSWIPSDATVTVPRVHKFDDQAHVIIMDDSGPGSINLKAFMQKGGPSLGMAKQIGSTIGEFLGELHRWGKGNQEVCAFFEGNQQAKRLSSWAFYGRLAQTLGGESGLPKLEEPPLTVSDVVMNVVKEIAEETQMAMMEVKDSFVMGDFWPGNLMVSLDDKGELQRIHVLDWELCKPGLLGIELGQFCAEIHLLRRFHEEVCRETSQLVLDNCLKSYVEKCGRDTAGAKRALVHWGTHMVVLGPRVEWGDKGRTRKAVSEGVDMIVQAYKGELSESVVSALH